MEKEFVKESIEHYQRLTQDYDEMIIEAKKKWVSPEISNKKRHAYKELINTMEIKKRACQKHIERLLNE